MFDLMPFHKRNEDLFSHMLRAFNEGFQANKLTSLNERFSTFRTDIVEKENAYYVEAELPGFDKKDINIDLNDNRLTIHAKRDQTDEQKDENDKVIRQERNYGEFVRSFYVDNINKDAITAKFENGLLKMEIPKLQPVNTQRKQIEIH